MKALLPLLLMMFLHQMPTQISSAPSTIMRSQKIYIEIAATELNSDATHLALSTSKFTWTDDRDNADLIFHLDRTIAKEHSQTAGNRTQFSVSWQIDLTVMDKNGKQVWKGTEPMDATNHRTKQTEDGWIEFLRRTAEYKVTKKFLASD